MNLNTTKSRTKGSSLWDFRSDRFQGGGMNFKRNRVGTVRSAPAERRQGVATPERRGLVSDVGRIGRLDDARRNPGLSAQALRDPSRAYSAFDRYQQWRQGGAAEFPAGEGGMEGAGGAGGAGGDPNANILVNEPVPDVGYRDPAEFGLSLVPGEDMKRYTEIFDTAMERIGGTADRLEAVNDAYLRGELPGDVVAEIRRNAAERGVASGAGQDSQVARNLRARDLGLTSLQVQQQGFAQAQVVAELRRVQGTLAESRRQFDTNYNLNVAQFLDTARRTDLTVVAMEQERLQFNAKQHLALVSYIAELTTSRAQIQATLASAGIDSEGAAAGFTQIISQMDRLLGK